ncbi:MAG TPA: hypothetical protein VH597_15695 [Verrucomicrobiae bacterium]|jgi:hypothetical protein|nr:hypothetical protein [Verrucomicrobiae bacterium]
MTALVSWLGVDSRGPSSVYIATDSAISWINKPEAKKPDAVWANGQKVFSCRTQPELFGFFGHVGFPTMVIGQLVELIDRGVLFQSGDSAEIKTERIHDLLIRSQKSHPISCGQWLLLTDFMILHATREGDGMKSRFRVWEHYWSSKNGWSSVEKEIPKVSKIITVGGSGTSAFLEWNKKWQDSPIARTSRAVFSAFCDALKSGKDLFCGGAPQIGGLFRTGVSNQFGVIYDQTRYIAGVEASDDWQNNELEWFNELFERCDPKTFTVKQGAQRQPRPKGI